MMFFILPILAAAQFQASHNNSCAQFVNANATCDPSDTLCFSIDIATQQCVDTFMQSQGAPAGLDQYGITNAMASLGLTNAVFTFAYMACNFQMTSFVTSQAQNQIYPGLRAMYECDAIASGIPSVGPFTTVFDSQGVCMNDPACVTAYSELRSHKLVEKQETEFVLNTFTNWYDLASTNDNDQMCACVFASLEIGNTALIQYLVAATYALGLIGVDPDKIVQHCTDTMNKQVMTLLVVATSVTFFIAALLFGGCCCWWHTGCSCSSNDRKDAYKAEEPVV